MITCIIAAHLPRFTSGTLTRAFDSVTKQTLLPSAIIIENDTDREGAPNTRHRALMKVTTPYFAVLDSDDYFLPQHLEKLWTTMKRTNADIVYSHYEVIGGADPRPWNFGVPYESGKEITSVILADTQKMKDLGGYYTDENLTDGRQFTGEDFKLSEKAHAAGYKIVHHPEKTWVWDHGSVTPNSSGLPTRW